MIPPAVFSHQGLVLPLKMRSPKMFDGTALLLGAAAPDFLVWMKYIVHHDGYQYFSHSFIGMLILLPIAVILSVVFSMFLMPWIGKTVKTLPTWLKSIGEYFGVDEWEVLKEKKYNFRWFGIAIYSAFIGILSHLMLDILGHNVNTLNVTTPNSPAYLSQVTYLPAWFGTPIGDTTFVNGNYIWLIEAIVFAILCLCYMHIIKRDHLLLYWYGKVPASDVPKNIYNDSNISENLETPPFAPSWTGLSGNLAISYWPPHIWVECKPKNYAIVLCSLILGGFLIELIYQIVYPPRADAPIYVRLMTISYVTGILSLMCILFDEKYTRALVIIFIPFLALLVYTLIADYDVLVEEHGKYFPIGALATHTWHFIVAGYLIFRKKWTDWQYLLNVGIIYFIYFAVLWQLDPDFKMVFMYGLTETLCYLTVSVYVMVLITYIVQRVRQK